MFHLYPPPLLCPFPPLYPITSKKVITLQPHAFAALTLGFACGSSFGGRNTSMASDNFFLSWHQLGTILWHEGVCILKTYYFICYAYNLEIKKTYMNLNHL